MRRRVLLASLAAAWLAPSFARAQQPRKMPLVGILDPGLPGHFDAFLAGMRALGYAAGQNVGYLQRSSEGRPDLVTQLASELADARVDVIVTTGPSPTRAAMKATSTIPIVFVLGDPLPQAPPATWPVPTAMPRACRS